MAATPSEIARICHEANRAYCQLLGDNTQLPYDLAPEWQRESIVKGVEYKLNNPDTPVSALHDAWMQEKLKAGWQYGPVKDAEKLLHPCLVPYDQLPIEQQQKDHLFAAIVLSFR